MTTMPTSMITINRRTTTIADTNSIGGMVKGPNKIASMGRDFGRKRFIRRRRRRRRRGIRRGMEGMKNRGNDRITFVEDNRRRKRVDGRKSELNGFRTHLIRSK